MPRLARLASRSACALFVLLAFGTACAQPERGASPSVPRLAVALVAPPAVAWLDGTRAGASLARPPIALAAGPSGAAIALVENATSPSSARPALALVLLPPPGGDRRPEPPIALPPVEHTGAIILASDGARYAAVAYQPRPSAPTSAAASQSVPCPLLLVDVLSRRIVSTSVPCRPHERLRSLALESASASPDPHLPGAIAYAGLEDVREGGSAVGRLVAVHLPSGAALASFPLAGSPVDVRLAPQFERAQPTLYVLEQSGGPFGPVPLLVVSRLLALDPLTMQPIRETALTAPALRVAPAPDGRSVILTAGDTVRRVDSASGTTLWVTRLPGIVVAAEVVGDQVYLAGPEARELWQLDVARGYRQPGRPLAGHPIALIPLK